MVIAAPWRDPGKENVRMKAEAGWGKVCKAQQVMGVHSLSLTTTHGYSEPSGGSFCFVGIILHFPSPNSTATSMALSLGERLHSSFSHVCSSGCNFQSERERANKKTMTFFSIFINLILEREKKERPITHENRFCFVTGGYNIYLSIQQIFGESCHVPGSILGLRWESDQVRERPSSFKKPKPGNKQETK